MNTHTSVKETINILTLNWRKTGLIMMFDALLVSIVSILWFVVRMINVWFIDHPFGSSQIIPSIVFMCLMVLELTLFLTVFSYFQYSVLRIIQEIRRKKAPEFDRFYSFIKLNLAWLVLAGGIFVIYFMTTSPIVIGLEPEGSMSTIKALGIALIVVLIGLALVIYLYTLLNIAHRIFLKEKRLLKIIEKGLINSFRPDMYRLYITDVGVLLAFGFTLFILHIFVKIFVLVNIQAYLNYYGYYKILIASLTILVGYSLLLFNRLNFSYTKRAI